MTLKNSTEAETDEGKEMAGVLSRGGFVYEVRWSREGGGVFVEGGRFRGGEKKFPLVRKKRGYLRAQT